MTATGQDIRPTHYNFVRDAILRHVKERPKSRAMLWVGSEDGAVIDQNFSEVWEDVKRAAAVLTEAGVKRGDTILILLSREREWWAADAGLPADRRGGIARNHAVDAEGYQIPLRNRFDNLRCCVIADAGESGSCAD